MLLEFGKLIDIYKIIIVKSNAEQIFAGTWHLLIPEMFSY